MAESVIVDNGYEEVLRANGLRDYGDYVDLASRGELVASSRSGRTHRVQIGEGGDAIGAYLKIHDYSYWRRSRWRRDKGALEAANYELLRDRCGVNVPEVIGRGWRTRGCRYVDGFIMTRAIEGAQSLESLAEDSSGKIDDSLLVELASVIRRMHAASYFHIDLQWRNILVVRHEHGSKREGISHGISIYLLDSPRGGLHASAVGEAHGRIRDLSSLHKDARRWLHPRAQLRWLKQYLGQTRLRPVDRAMIRTILRDRAIKDYKRTA